MDIRGLGYERVRALLAAQLIENVADLYDRMRVGMAQLLTLDGFAEKSATQVLAAIDASKDRPLSTLLFALGIRHVGEQSARLLARQFGTMPALAAAKPDAIAAVRGVGPAIAEAVSGFFAEPRNRKLIQRLGRLGLNMQEPVEGAGAGGALAGQTFVITGTLPGISREQAAELIRGAGGNVTDSVSKKTSAVVVGANAGSKLERAKALGVPLIDEAELLRRARSIP
jgi:DNA ligase (NAD+)